MRDHSNHIELTREEATKQMLEQPLWEGMRRGCEFVELDEAIGRVLAEDVTAKVDSPNCLTCKMDSIALKFEDIENGLWKDEFVPRGEHWQFANTGVAMPEGFDTAVMVEHVEFSDDGDAAKLLGQPCKKGEGTSETGSRFSVGKVLVEAGTRLTPLDVAVIHSGNVSAVKVRRKPRIVFIPTGNELAGGNGAVELGKNIETNSLLVKGKVRAWGGEPVAFDIVPDDRAAIEEAVKRAAEVADIVVLNGGSSKGSDDWCIEVLDEIGHVVAHQMLHGPGRHCSLTVLNDVNIPVVGVSGPPAGVEFVLDFYLKPLVLEFLGLDPKAQLIPARLAQVFPDPSHPGAKEGAKDGKKPLSRPRSKAPNFSTIRLVKVEFSEDGVLEATPVEGMPGSDAAKEANAYTLVRIGEDAPEYKVGDIIQIEYR